MNSNFIVFRMNEWKIGGNSKLLLLYGHDIGVYVVPQLTNINSNLCHNIFIEK